jgi:NAD(P)-dependent dehydrogenase (short-subunit alcohol dehydrogenase family)
MAPRTWLITGTSRGFGREWAAAALARGDRVVGTARGTSATDDLTAKYPNSFRALQLDVTDRAAVFEAVEQAHDHFGELDIVVNNAGYGHFGMIEEASEKEARAQIETNLFGALWVTQAALPYLRARGAGHIIQVSSIGGITAFPTLGIYHASKWGLEGFSQALAHEVKPFGINVTLIEPGGFSTDWAGSSAERSEPIHAYDELRADVQRMRATEVPGNPAASATALHRIVDAEEPPLRCFFGGTPLEIAEADYASRLVTWRAWEPVAKLAQG